MTEKKISDRLSNLEATGVFTSAKVVFDGEGQLKTRLHN